MSDDIDDPLADWDPIDELIYLAMLEGRCTVKVLKITPPGEPDPGGVEGVEHDD